MERPAINTSLLGADSRLVINDNLAFGGKDSCNVKSLNVSHPLETKLVQHDKKQEEVNMHILQKMQGMHAPLRLHMERQAVKGVGHLPCLHRHNALMDALTGRDTTMDFEDFLNTPQDSELAGTPHVVIERHLGIF